MKTLSTFGVTALLLALLAWATPVDGQCLQCGEYTCVSAQHQATGNPPPFGWFGNVHGCSTGSCESHHGVKICYPQDEDLDLDDLLAMQSLGTLGPTEIARLMDNYPDRVVWNAARGALQVLGCDGVSVAAHVSLAPDQVTPYVAQQQ